MKKITFIIPIYNVELVELMACVNSIVDEKFDNYEIIIVNDGYCNGEIENFCKELSLSNKNVKYLFQENKGSAVARNSGLDHASGDYIMFVDADDLLVQNLKIELTNLFAVKKQLEFAIFDYSFWSQNGEDVKSLKYCQDFIGKKEDVLSNIMFFPDKIQNFMFGSIWAKIFSRKFLNSNNIRFKPELRKAQDRRFMLDVIYNATSIPYYPIYVYKYKTNNNSICHKMNYKMIAYYERLYSSIIEFKNETQLDDDIFKFVEYSILNELLPLCIFHVENKKSFGLKKKELDELYNYYSLDYVLKKIKLAELPSFKAKIKFLLYRFKCYGLLNAFFVCKQKNEIKKSFE
ncbi:Glycosyltransferase involved in cell wall bisynthesis [Streptococcus equinus]|nr:Glycosyltransferase involved in cell wall bisynthesis [Streptococcus equinus]